MNEHQTRPEVKLPDTLTIAILLLPGFITERVSEYYSTGAKLSDVETVAAALAVTLVDATIALGIVRAAERIGRRPPNPFTTLVTSLPFLSTLVVVAVAVGAAWAVIDSSDFLYRHVNLTGRTSRSDVWQKAFRENRGWKNFVKVTIKDGATYHGHPRFYSEGADENTVFLSPAFIEVADAPEKPRAGSASRGQTAAAVQGTKIEGAMRRRCLSVPGRGVLINKSAIQAVEFRTLPQQEKYPCPGV